MVRTVTVRKTLREAEIKRLEPVRRASARAGDGSGVCAHTFRCTDAHRRSTGVNGMNTDLTDS